MAQDYKRLPIRFSCTGICFNAAKDNLPEGKYPLLQNIRSIQFGTLQPRWGLGAPSGASSPIGLVGSTPMHSVRRLNDPAGSAYTHIVGSGSALGHGTSSFSSVDTGYSGNPLSMVPFRPDKSPAPWMYVADSSRMRKISRTGTVQQIGLPSMTFNGGIGYNEYANFGDVVITRNVGTGWTADGTIITSGSVASATRKDSTDITAAVADLVGFGWTIYPATISNLGPGVSLYWDGGIFNQYLVIDSVSRGSAAYTISTISYETGGTGLCSIVLNSPCNDIMADSLVEVGSTPNYYRVLSTHKTDDGKTALRVYATVTHAAGESLQAVPSFRTRTFETITTTSKISVAGTAATVSGAGTGTISKTTVANPFYYNDINDILHFSVFIGTPKNFTAGKIIFDMGTTSHYVGADVASENHYFFEFRQSDLTGVVANLKTYNQVRRGVDDRLDDGVPDTDDFAIVDRQAATDVHPREGPLYREIPDLEGEQTGEGGGVRIVTNPGYRPPGPGLPSPKGSDTASAGQNQWTEFMIPLSSLIRVGTDKSKGFKDVTTLKFSFTCTGATPIGVDSVWVGGGSGPNAGTTGIPYRYRVRGRNSTTGAMSGPSPETREALVPRRTATTLSFAAHPSSDCDKIDIERFGGTINEWRYLATVDNSGGTISYTDKTADDTIIGNPTLPEDHYQPWILLGAPTSGTITKLAGTIVDGTGFNTSWVPGTEIYFPDAGGSGSRPYAIRNVISTTKMELFEAVGGGAISTWNVPEPYTAGNPLPCLWGDYEGYHFACGDSLNPGRLYITNRNDPDSTKSILYVELTNPSEPLMNGCVYNGQCYVFSSERIFTVRTVGPDQFVFQELPNSKGLLSRWGLVVGPKIFFLGKDGIYATEGGVCYNLSNDLYPIFPHDGTSPYKSVYLPINLPDFTQTASLRLSWYDGHLYFTFKDTVGSYRTLVCDFRDLSQPELLRWISYDVYTPGMTYLYGSEGSGVHELLLCGADTTTGKLYAATQATTTDNGTGIGWQVITPKYDLGDPRADKQWGDCLLDLDAGSSGTITYSITQDLGGTNMASGTITTSPRAQTLVDFSSGAGAFSPDIGLILSGTTVANSYPQLYLWEPSALVLPDDAKKRATDWMGDPLHARYVQGARIEVDTANVAKSYTIQYDDYTSGPQTGATFSITANGRSVVPVSFPPFIAHLVRLISSDSVPAKLYSWEPIWEPIPELATTWTTEPQTFGYSGYFHLRRGFIGLMSSATVVLTVTVDGTAYTYNLASTGGAFQKVPVAFQPVKGLSAQFSLTSTQPFRLYKQETEVLAKMWGSNGVYDRLKPFGDQATMDGARI